MAVNSLFCQFVRHTVSFIFNKNLFFVGKISGEVNDLSSVFRDKMRTKKYPAFAGQFLKPYSSFCVWFCRKQNQTDLKNYLIF